jgi:hypothetical protein
MSDQPEPRPETGETNRERREALIKLGKYTAYAAPVVLVSMSQAQGQPISGIPAPVPPPAPPPEG